jgi:hypothetical protein
MPASALPETSSSEPSFSSPTAGAIAGKALGSRPTESGAEKSPQSVSSSFTEGARQPPPFDVWDAQYDPMVLGSIDEEDAVCNQVRPVQLSCTVPAAMV